MTMRCSHLALVACFDERANGGNTCVKIVGCDVHNVPHKERQRLTGLEEGDGVVHNNLPRVHDAVFSLAAIDELCLLNILISR